MPKSFSFNTTREPERLIVEAKKMARKYGATIEGDARQGCIAGDGYRADYSIKGDTVLVTVLKKPILAPWFMVKAAIKEFLA